MEPQWSPPDRYALGFPPDADENGNYAFFDAANYALIQMTGGVTAIPVVQINRSHTNEWGVKRGIMPKIMLASGVEPKVRGGRRWRDYAYELPLTACGGSVVELIVEDYESSTIN